MPHGILLLDMYLPRTLDIPLGLIYSRGPLQLIQGDCLLEGENKVCIFVKYVASGGNFVCGK